jgi:hypothetical protein
LSYCCHTDLGNGDGCDLVVRRLLVGQEVVPAVVRVRVRVRVRVMVMLMVMVV